MSKRRPLQKCIQGTVSGYDTLHTNKNILSLSSQSYCQNAALVHTGIQIRTCIAYIRLQVFASNARNILVEAGLNVLVHVSWSTTRVRKSPLHMKSTASGAYKLAITGNKLLLHTKFWWWSAWLSSLTVTLVQCSRLVCCNLSVINY